MGILVTIRWMKNQKNMQGVALEKNITLLCCDFIGYSVYSKIIAKCEARLVSSRYIESHGGIILRNIS